MKSLVLDESVLAELLSRGRAGEVWHEIEKDLGHPHVLRRRWVKLATDEDKELRKTNIAKLRLERRLAREAEAEEEKHGEVQPAPECQFDSPGIYYHDDPRALAPDRGRPPMRPSSWVPVGVAGAWSER